MNEKCYSCGWECAKAGVVRDGCPFGLVDSAAPVGSDFARNVGSRRQRARTQKTAGAALACV